MKVYELIYSAINNINKHFQLNTAKNEFSKILFNYEKVFACSNTAVIDGRNIRSLQR